MSRDALAKARNIARVGGDNHVSVRRRAALKRNAVQLARKVDVDRVTEDCGSLGPLLFFFVFPIGVFQQVRCLQAFSRGGERQPCQRIGRQERKCGGKRFKIGVRVGGMLGGFFGLCLHGDGAVKDDGPVFDRAGLGHGFVAERHGQRFAVVGIASGRCVAVFVIIARGQSPDRQHAVLTEAEHTGKTVRVPDAEERGRVARRLGRRLLPERDIRVGGRGGKGDDRRAGGKNRYAERQRQCCKQFLFHSGTSQVIR